MTDKIIQLPPMPKPSDYGYDPRRPSTDGTNMSAKAAYDRALEAWERAAAAVKK